MRIRWRGLELPSKVVPEATDDPNYGVFVAEPFERGFGHTLGNPLRRILLSSLEGAAVTSARIAGVQHEFSTLPGVLEDVTEICLNLKSLVVKSTAAGPKTVRIEKSGKGVVTGADVITDDQIEVISKDLVLATLTDDVSLSIELTIETGRGYVRAAERDAETVEPGTIPLDAAFSPVVRVRHEVAETRVGQKTNYDKLTLHVWTNGSLTPEMALVEASKILRKHLNPFISYQEPGPEMPPEAGLRGMIEMTGYAPVDLELEEKLGQSLAELNLSVRATNCLESEGITSVRDLVTKTEDELLQVRNFGETTLVEVRERLQQLQLRLGMRLPSRQNA